MILAFDVGYQADSSLVAIGEIVSFERASDFKVASLEIAATPAEYVPGKFYLRELPLLLQALEDYDLSVVEMIIIDGYVDLKVDHPGLGAYLYEALEEKIPIIGVAKSYYRDTDALPILRGDSQKPLYVSSRGIDTNQAALLIQGLPGKYRMPDFLQAVDRKTKG